MYDYQAKPDVLRDRIILVTGAGDGIGRRLALQCARYGATLILLGRTIRKLEQVYDEIEQNGGVQPAIYPMNLEAATPKDYFDLAQVLDKEFGRLDGLVHNAVFFQGLTPIANTTAETWFRSLQVNLNAPFLLTQALLDVLGKSVDASVIFTADSVSERGQAYWSGYAVAKGGIASLMKMLASELETNTTIRVNSVDPGPVRTRLRMVAYPALDRSSWVEPDAILAPYLYLLGPDSNGITGQCLQAQD
ncbi:MAG: YciK family oxidoreductase [Candidatus Competibacteraceae bacterium]|nr:YciK family oxidoreductase [Candidatus Competibacteraceae bacterium]